MQNENTKVMNVRSLIKSLKNFPKDAKVIFTHIDNWNYPPSDNMYVRGVEYDDEVQIVRLK